jgi:hypothetical protein
MPMMLPRRLQEAAEDLIDDGAPIVGISSTRGGPRGVFWAEKAEEMLPALEETEKRARKSMTRRRRQRRVYRELLGQEALRAVEGQPA